MPTSRAADKVNLRNTWFTSIAPLFPPGAPDAQLAARFGSFANTIQTRMDTSSGTGPPLTGSLEAQVDRALSQVLRQAPAGGPSGPYGQELTELVTQAVMAGGPGSPGGPPAIAPLQAVLLREGTLIKGDALSVLDVLQPLSALADPSDVGSVTAIVRAEVNLLVEEFSRTTLRPRAQRVRVLLGGLLGWNPAIPIVPPFLGDTGTLLTLLNLGGPMVPTLLVEQQLASQGVLTSDTVELLNQWLGYQQNEPGIPPPWEALLGPRLLGAGGLGNLGPQPGVPPTMALGPASAQAQFRLAVISPGPPPGPALSYAERLIQTDLLLPVVAQDAARVAAALDAIGLSPGEQETTYLNLQSLVDLDLLPFPGVLPPPPLPGPPLPAGSFVPVQVTLTDLLGWTASMAGGPELELVRQAGQLGLNLIADQADELFWLVIALLYPNPGAGLAELTDAQVQAELLTLARDLELLADLAV